MNTRVFTIVSSAVALALVTGCTAAYKNSVACRDQMRSVASGELAASETLAELGVVPLEDAALLRRHASFDVPRIFAIEAETRHDVIAFTTAVAESMARAASSSMSGNKVSAKRARFHAAACG